MPAVRTGAGRYQLASANSRPATSAAIFPQSGAGGLGATSASYAIAQGHADTWCQVVLNQSPWDNKADRALDG